MDLFLDSKEVSFEDREILNYVRYFLEVMTLAEITTSNRKRIRPECFNPEWFLSKKEMNKRHEPDKWPQHLDINKTTKKKWKAALIATVCNSEGYLHKRLGYWLVVHKRWEHLSDGLALYRVKGGKWYAHGVKEQTRSKVTHAK
eukprot:2486255-Ditylum_brightwellii.AAC.1